MITDEADFASAETIYALSGAAAGCKAYAAEITAGIESSFVAKTAVFT
jgi:hypothetical protein